MIANFFNQTKPINFLVLSAMTLFLFLLSMRAVLSAEINIMLVAKYGSFCLLSILIVFVLNFIIRKNSLCEDNSYGILFYILFYALFPMAFVNGGIFVSNFLLLFAFRRIYSLRSTLHTREKIFDSAFWIALASFFYVWAIAYVLLLYVAILVFRKMDWRTLLIPLVGLATPIFLLYVFTLAFDDVEGFQSIWTYDYSIDLKPYGERSFLIPLLILLVLTIISILPTTKRALIAKIDFKATWQLLIFHIVIGLSIAMIAPVKDGSEWSFVFFPLSILFANYLQLLNKYWYKEAIIYLFLLLVITSNYLL